jgi:hypothetical protein
VFRSLHKKDWVVLAGIPVLFFIAYFYNDLPLNGFEFCAVKRFLDIPCPGCGLTRSFAQLVHGNLVAALKFNIFGPILAIIFIYIFIRRLLGLLLKRPVPALLTTNQRYYVTIAFIVLFMVQWVIKVAL